MRLYWVLFPTDDLRLAEETAKRIFTEEKIDRQLVAQSTMTQFMNIRDGYHSKKAVIFHMQDKLDDKMDKLMSIMSKLIAQGNNQNKQFKPKIHPGKKSGQTKKYYDQGNYQNR